MMADFAKAVENEPARDRLLRAIHGRGAFRCFRNEIEDHDLAEQWYAFRDARYRELALEWCRDNGVECDAEGGA